MKDEQRIFLAFLLSAVILVWFGSRAARQNGRRPGVPVAPVSGAPPVAAPPAPASSFAYRGTSLRRIAEASPVTVRHAPGRRGNATGR